MDFTKWGSMVYAAPFFVFGVFHFVRAGALSGYVPGYIPFATLWVYVTGVIFIAASVAIISGKYARELSLLLAAQLLVFVLLVHLPASVSAKAPTSDFLKDIALLGGALMAAKQSRRTMENASGVM